MPKKVLTPILTLILAFGSLLSFPTPVFADTLSDLGYPFAVGETWYVYQGYNSGSHGGGLTYGLDLVQGSATNVNTAAVDILAPIGGTVGNHIRLCGYSNGSYAGWVSPNLSCPGGQVDWGEQVNITFSGGTVSLQHLNVVQGSGSIAKGTKIGTVFQGYPGGVNHLHIQLVGAYLEYGVWNFPNRAPISGETNGAYSGKAITNPVVTSHKFAADFDNDGTDDISIKEADGDWKIDYAANGFGGWDDDRAGYGGPNLIPLPGDYDDDGDTDMATRDNVHNFFRIDYAANGFGGWEDQLLDYGNVNTVPIPADYNGDGSTDIAIRDNINNYFRIDFGDVNSLTNHGFNGWDVSFPNFGDADAVPVPADYNGDGAMDMAIRSNTSGYLQIDYGNNTAPTYGYGSWDESIPGFGGAALITIPGDYDGDGDADVASRDNDYELLRIDYAVPNTTNNGFNGWELSPGGFQDENTTPIRGNFDGDTGTGGPKHDIAIVDSNGTWRIDKAQNGFGAWDLTIMNYGGSEALTAIGDYDNDGIDDISVKADSGNWYTDFAAGNLGGWDNIVSGFVSLSSAVPIPADYDGDGITDRGVKANANGYLYINVSSDGLSDSWDVTMSGLQGANFVIVPGDFNNDTYDDIAIRIDNNGFFFIDYANPASSNNGFNGWDVQSVYNYGDASYHVVPGDYNYDGYSDLAVRRDVDGYFLIDYANSAQSNNGFNGWDTALTANYGQSGTHTFSGNFDGDLASGIPKTDIAMKDDNTGHLRIDFAANGYGSWDIQVAGYGGSGAKHFSGDFNGDGNTDFGVRIISDRTFQIDYADPLMTDNGFGSWQKILKGYNGNNVAL